MKDLILLLKPCCLECENAEYNFEEFPCFRHGTIGHSNKLTCQHQKVCKRFAESKDGTIDEIVEKVLNDDGRDEDDRK